MAVPSWPSALPASLLLDGYHQSLGDSLIRSSMDTGPAKVRPRTSNVIEPVQGEIIVTGDQLATLRTFHDSTLNRGARRFAWKDPANDDSVEFRFTAPPSWSAEGKNVDGIKRYRVTLELELLP